ncbi:MAG: hypothetical protein KF892_23590 [Rhizobacter sp.]|nr:hypothetical protein [Rhizobacter sp.]
MYQEIASYNGDFGDAIAEFVDFEPLAVLMERHAEVSIRQGAAIGLLVNFSVALDNSDYVSALKAKEHKEMEIALKMGFLKEFPPIEAAAIRSRDGEQAFSESLRSVYLAYVKEAA